MCRAQAASGGWVSLRPTGAKTGWPRLESLAQPLSSSFVFQSSRVSWSEARDPRVYRPILIAVLMRFLQQLTGITPILVYLQTIFDSTSVVLVRTHTHTLTHPGQRCPESREAAEENTSRELGDGDLDTSGSHPASITFSSSEA